jgi:succinyl-diaminopimelate desuccinylase
MAETTLEAKILNWIDDHRDEIIEGIQENIRIPSVKGEPADGAPFGQSTRDALDNAIKLGERYGLVGKHLDGYASHLEWVAEGVAPDAPIVGVLGHVDVVPPGSGWVRPPFGAEIEDDILYSRGAIDDKGPILSALFGLIAILKAGAPSLRRVRVILGADEESGFGCVNHYFAHEEMPETGFTPDGDFPLVHAEKGITDIVLSSPIPAGNGTVSLVGITAGNRTNMVPDRAVATFTGSLDALNDIGAAIKDIDAVSAELSGDTLSVTAIGVSAHGSLPELGVNAVAVLTHALRSVALPQQLATFLATIENWATDTTGAALGIAWSDEVSGPLTSNLGVVATDGEVRLTFNIRYPVTDDIERIKEEIGKNAVAAGFSVASVRDAKPLYVPLDDPLITTLLDVYRTQTGDMRPAMTMGGGTYARSMVKGVAFGPGLPSIPGGPHQSDECWPIHNLIDATKIYALAILRLANLPLQ